MRNKNILFIIPSLLYGGAEYQTVQQCNALLEKGWNVFLCILTGNNPLAEKLRLSQKSILVLSTRSESLNFNSAFVRISDIKRLSAFTTKHKITHVVANLPLGHWYGRILKLINRSIILFNYHRSLQYEANPLDTFPKKVFNIVQSKLANFTDDVSICISDAVKTNINSHFNLINPVVIYNSVPDRFPEMIRFHHGSKASHDRLTLVLPGRLHPSKGQLFFLSALWQASTLFRNRVKIILAGGGALEQEVEKKILEYQLEDIVHITGFLENNVLLQKIYEADLVVIPSLHEGLGNVAIETLMLGKTMIVSNAGGLKEVVQNKVNGYMFEAGNEKDLLAVMEQVVFDYPRSILSKDILRKSYLERFSFESHINAFLSVIEQ